MNADASARKARGGRPKGDPAAVRGATIGVRVSPAEHAALLERAGRMHMSPAQWLREAALTRTLPPPPVAAVNRAQYVELARLASNLNQLAHLANEGGRVIVSDHLLRCLTDETRRLRRALLGVKEAGDDR